MSVDGKRCTVVVQPGGWELDGSDQVSLLEAALLSDIRLPSSCRNGTCRECMCLLISGRVRYRVDWPGLSLDEKEEGFILPCVACPESDVVIDAPRATVVCPG
jgi:ferredoxin